MNKLKIVLGISLWLIPNFIICQNWVTVDTGFNNMVKTLTFDSVANKLYAIGIFGVAGGSVNNLNNIAQYDGVSWDSVPVINNSPPNIGSVAVYNNKIAFTSADQILLTDGISLDTIASHTNGGILSLFVNNTDLYALGVFDSIMGVITGGIARWDGTTWSALDTSTHWASGFFFNCAAFYNGDLYIGGNFIDQTGTLDRLARWDGTHWYPVGGGITGGLSDVFCMEVYNNKLYVGGMFNMSNGNPGNAIASWDGSQWDNVGGGMTQSYAKVKDLQVYNYELYAGGQFDYAGGRPIKGIAKWNGTEWCGLGFDANNTAVNTLAVYNNDLYLGGYFRTVLGDTMNYITKWNGGNYTDTCGSLTGVNEISPLSDNMNIFPNPSNGVFTISAVATKIKEVRVMDVMGRIVNSEELSANSTSATIDMSGYAKGIYFVRIVSTGSTTDGSTTNVVNRKIVLQ